MLAQISISNYTIVSALEMEFAAAVEARACETAANKDSGAFGSMAGVGHDPLDAGIIAL